MLRYVDGNSSTLVLGQHNHELLSRLGLTDDEIAELEAQGVIGTAPAMHGTSKV